MLTATGQALSGSTFADAPAKWTLDGITRLTIPAMALILAVGLVGRGSESAGLHAVLVILAPAAIIDATSLRLPNPLMVATLAAALTAWLAAGAPLAPMLAAGIVGAVMLVAYLIGGVGAGDVKALPSLVLAATVPLEEATGAVLLTPWMLVGVFGITAALHITARLKRSEPAPMGPGMFLTGAAVLTFLP